MENLPARFAQAALDHWNQLGATTGKHICQYVYQDGTRCVIGWGLTDDQIQEIREADENAQGVHDICHILFGHEGRLTERERDQLALLSKLQQKHDDACRILEHREDNGPELQQFRDVAEAMAAKRLRVDPDTRLVTDQAGYAV